jgi:hypothetical protein
MVGLGCILPTWKTAFEYNLEPSRWPLERFQNLF